jgi:predicted lipoprotein with Yx(FWY)xxD motif
MPTTYLKEPTMPLHPHETYETTSAGVRTGFSVPRGLIAGTLAASALVWGPYAVIPRSSLLFALLQTGIYLGLLTLTICSRRAKVLLVRTVQRFTINPLMRLLLAVGVNPFGLAILETRGHLSGKTRRVPVGNGRMGDSFWIIAEHGTRAGYVRNIEHDPHVRVRLRIGLRFRWVRGIATVWPDDDPLARQRQIIAWHPLRALNAINVRVGGADLLSVHVRLDTAPAGDSERPVPTVVAQPKTPLLTFAPKVVTAIAVIPGLIGLVVSTPAAASSGGFKSGGTVITAEPSPYGEVLEVGSGQFAGYSVYQFDRNSVGACNATTLATAGGHPITCTGSETDANADWPIVSSVGKPVAGSGVNPKLLGTVYRTDLKEEQVTYAGKLLYLFDDQPHEFTGVNYIETVLPLPPWHGLWALVSPKNGSEVTGSITLTTQAQPTGGSVLVADMFQGVFSIPIVVYTYSADTKNHSNCSGACSLDWPPVLSSEAPQVSGLPPRSMGTIERSDGQTQITYKGHPLYFYSEEVPRLNPITGLPLNPATDGTGNGLIGPNRYGTFTIVTVDDIGTVGGTA